MKILKNFHEKSKIEQCTCMKKSGDLNRKFEDRFEKLENKISDIGKNIYKLFLAFN